MSISVDSVTIEGGWREAKTEKNKVVVPVYRMLTHVYRMSTRWHFWLLMGMPNGLQMIFVWF